jgi:hypothetical protein
VLKGADTLGLNEVETVSGPGLKTD